MAKMPFPPKAPGKGAKAPAPGKSPFGAKSAKPMMPKAPGAKPFGKPKMK